MSESNGRIRHDLRVKVILEDVAATLDRRLNAPFGAPELGFMIQVFPFGIPSGKTEKRCSYVTNLDPSQVAEFMADQAEELGKVSGR